MDADGTALIADFGMSHILNGGGFGGNLDGAVSESSGYVMSTNSAVPVRWYIEIYRNAHRSQLGFSDLINFFMPMEQTFIFS